MKLKLNFLKKLTHRPSAKTGKGEKFDPQDWQTVVKIVFAVLTLVASLLGDELGLPDGGKDAQEEPPKPAQPDENDLDDVPFPASDFEPKDPPFDPEAVSDLQR